MSKNKLERFAILDRYPHVHQNPNGLKGNWASQFAHQKSIILELACGKGEYTVDLAERYPDNFYIGIDIKGARIYHGATMALRAGMDNAHFARMQIDHIEEWFAPGEVDEIWITFPDPFLSETKARKRLTHPLFLSRYQRILKPGAIIHLKTDNTLLYEYTLSVLEEYKLPILELTPDLYPSALYKEELQVKTTYEKIFHQKGEKIKYIKWVMPGDTHFGIYEEKGKLRKVGRIEKIISEESTKEKK